MAMEIVQAGRDRLSVRLDGELDHHETALLRPLIDRELAEHRPRELVLDFGGVVFMDSSGIGLVMGRYRLMSEWGGAVRVTGLSAQQRRVMSLAGLGRIVRIEGREKGAVRDGSDQ